MKEQREKIINEIDKIIEMSGNIRESKYDLITIYNLTLQAIIQYSPPDSSFRITTNSIIDTVNFNDYVSIGRKMDQLIDVLVSLKYSYENQLLSSIEEFIHADIFNDFLDMSEYLLEKEYKDAPAVIIGSTLEQHQKKLALKYNIDVKKTNKKGETLDKKNNEINDELRKANAYNSIEHKQIIAWLDIRNHASHGEWNDYNIDQVKSMLNGVREYMLRNPA